MALGLLALVVWMSAWLEHRRVDARERVFRDAPPPAIRNEAGPGDRAPDPRWALRLLPSSELPLALSRIERAFTSNGLPWTAAEYATLPALDAEPARVEVRSVVKAPYPVVRASLGALLGSVPGSTLKALAFQRPTVDAEEVEARVEVEVFLSGDPTTANGGPPR